MDDDQPEPDRTGASALTRLERSSSHRFDQHLRPFFECWLDTFIFRGRIDAQLRERVILRIMWRCAQPYEWGNHYRLAREAGLADEDILAVRTADPARDLAGPVAIAVRAADEIVDLGHLTESTLTALEPIMPGLRDEFLYLVAGYRMFASVAASRREERGGPLWPPDGVAPVPVPPPDPE